MHRYIALHDLGYYEYRVGNLETSIACFSQCYRWLIQENSESQSSRDLLCGNLAASYALLGDLPAARAWLPSSIGSSLDTGKIVGLARCGEYAEVLRLRDGAYPRQYRTVLSHYSRVAALMKAFSRDQLGEVGTLDIEAARPRFATEYDYLIANWPELRAFTEALSILDKKAITNLPQARLLPGKDTE